MIRAGRDREASLGLRSVVTSGTSAGRPATAWTAPPGRWEPRSRSKKALAGEIKNFTGVDDAYEAPEHPELVLDTMVETPEQSLQNLLTRLRELGYIEDATVMVEGDRVHSGQTDLRLTDTGHVAGGR